MVYLISYDLNTPGQNYDALTKRIESFEDYFHVLKSTWLISTNKSSKEVYEVLRTAGDKNDNILINQITPNYWGWLPNEVWTWLQARV